MKFPKNFLWGVSTAAYQVEGAAGVDGKGLCSWDAFSQIPGKVYAGENGNVAVDQYHRYREDIALMHTLGIDSYRFSIAWSRVYPHAGEDSIRSNGPLNQKGLDYYHRLVDCLLEHNIAPMITLYHWDLPIALLEKGGWTHRDCSYCFQEYAHTVFNALGDRVKMWSPHNEPWCSTILGYVLGMHAPGLKNKTMAYKAIHHINLSHGLAVQCFRSSKAKKGKIGPVVNLFTPQPATNSPEDALAADRSMDRDCRMFLNPIFGKAYPERHLQAQGITLPIKSGDMDIIKQPIDFIGLNYYTEQIASYNSKKVEQFVLKPTSGLDCTSMGWPIVPEGIVRNMEFVQKEYGNIALYITENGSAWPDKCDGTSVYDYNRIHYLRSHIEQCKYALDKGINLKGYFSWSFIDNFEWALGYTQRFGLVYCDYAKLTRIPKASFYAYQNIIAHSR